jgi:hypothetical protein
MISAFQPAGSCFVSASILLCFSCHTFLGLLPHSHTFFGSSKRGVQGHLSTKQTEHYTYPSTLVLYYYLGGGVSTALAYLAGAFSQLEFLS